MKEDLKNKLKNANNKSPIIILGVPSTEFSKIYNIDIYSIENIPEGSDGIVIDIGSNIESLDICKNLNRPVIVLANDINLDLNKLSNIKTVIKYSNKSKSALRDSKDALQLWKEEENNNSYYNFCANESPELYYYKKKFSMNKYIELFSSNL